MRRKLRWIRKAVRFAIFTLRAGRTSGLPAAVRHALRHLASRYGILSQLRELRQQLAELREREKQVAQSVSWLVQCQAAAPQRPALLAESADPGPLISIVMPVHNRRSLVGAAIDSVLNQSYPNWELLVVDDGSTDGSREIIESRLLDPRVRLLSQEHQGVSQARNHALREARGEIIAYLDSDNEWFPGFLTEVGGAFDRDPDIDCVYAAQLVDEEEGKRSWIRSAKFDRQAFRESNGIDLNVFAHRRQLVERFGGFDEQLTRLVDWDLVIRFTQHRDPAPIPIVGGRYRAYGGDRIYDNGEFARNYYLVRRKHEPPVQRELRVLYVVWDYPQLTETYVRWEIACLKRSGVCVEVWSEVQKTASPYETDVPVHRGSLEDAIRKFKPHVAHVHWLNIAMRYSERIARAGLQMTVRGHGFEFNDGTLPHLLSNAAVQRIYLFPHFLLPWRRDARIQPMTSAFNGDLYYPPADKDPFLVVRTASAKPAKAVETFIDVAAQCPQHRFVLVLGVLNNLEHCVQQIQDYNQRLGSPVDIRINLPTEEAAALVREAGIYLHTYGTDEPFGMPISIAEAMATGAFVLVRDLPGAAEYVEPVGAVYTTADQAAQIIRQSARWYDEQWQDQRRRTVEFAYQRYADIDVLRPLLDDWQRIADAGIHPSLVIDELQAPDLEPALHFLMDDAELIFMNNFGRSYLSHVVGASARLSEWGAEPDVRKAALFHSIYIDSRVPPTPENRSRIRALIGERAERLAYAFCAVAFVDIEPMLETNPPFRFPDQIVGGMLQVTAEDFDDLCLIHLAEWTEKAQRCPEGRLNPQFYQKIAERLGGPGAVAFLSSKNSPVTDEVLQPAA